MPETCAKCKQPTVAAHQLTLDGARRLWRLCCLCTGELIGLLDRDEAPVGGEGRG